MKTGPIYVISIVLSCLTIHVDAAESKKCDLEIQLTNPIVDECDSKPKNELKIDCFKKLFGPQSKIQLSHDGRFSRATIRAKDKVVCLNDFKLLARGRESSIGFDRKNDSAIAVGFYTALKIGRFSIPEQDRICGLKAGGKFTLKLRENYKFIPQSAEVAIEGIKCLDTGTIEGDAIVLTSKTTICGSTLPAGTRIGGADDFRLSFVALGNATMSVVIDGVASELKIEKGKTYGNPDPKNQPCNWSEKVAPAT